MTSNFSFPRLPNIFERGIKNAKAALLVLLTLQIHAAPVFKATSEIPVPYAPTAVLIGDVDNNGTRDILVADESLDEPTTDGLSRLLGDGMGLFSAPQRLLLNPSAPSGIRAALLTEHNGDGVPDLTTVACVTAFRKTCFTTGYLNNGNGEFDVVFDNTLDNTPGILVVGNFLGGDTPAVATPFGASLVTSTIIDGFPSTDTIRPAANGNILDIAIGDVDSDGITDLFLAVPDLQEVGLFYGFADFQFRRATIAAGFAPRWLAAGDLDNDGRGDLVATDADLAQIGIFLNDAAGGLQAPVFTAIGGIGSAVALGDFDGDTNLDIAVAVADFDEVDILLNDGAGGFSLCSECTFSVGDEPREIAVGDLNNDGLADVVTGNVGSVTLSVLHTAQLNTTTSLVAAILPTSRSVQVNAVASVFATVINAGSITAEGCTVVPQGNFGPFRFQTTDSASNAPTGQSNEPVTIPALGAQSFVLTLEPDRVLTAEDIVLRFTCDNASDAPSISGLNTWLVSSSAVPVADVIALAATTSGNGVVDIAAAGAAFAVAAANVGAAATIDVVALVRGGAGVTVSLCETDPLTSVCVNPTTPSASGTTVTIESGATPTFGVFLNAISPVPFDPANARISVEFRDTNGVVRGSTSVAMRTVDE